MNHRILLRAAAVAYAGVVFTISVLPVGAVLDPGSRDKWAHFFSYVVMGVLWSSASRRPMTAAVAAALFGLAIEGVQSLLPYRTGDLGDIAADAAGAFVGCFLMRFRSSSEAKPSSPPRSGD